MKAAGWILAGVLGALGIGVAVVLTKKTGAGKKVAHRDRAVGVHPKLIALLDAWEAWPDAPFDIVVVADGGVRDDATQARLFADGKTNALKAAQSAHGHAGAVDLAPYRRQLQSDGRNLLAPDFRSPADFAVIGRFAEERGFVWGGNPGFVAAAGFKDLPHVQLPDWKTLPLANPPRSA